MLKECIDEIKFSYFLTDIKKESTEDFFNKDLFPSFKSLLSVSDKSPVILIRT